VADAVNEHHQCVAPEKADCGAVFDAGHGRSPVASEASHLLDGDPILRQAIPHSRLNRDRFPVSHPLDACEVNSGGTTNNDPIVHEELGQSLDGSLIAGDADQRARPHQGQDCDALQKVGNAIQSLLREVPTLVGGISPLQGI
jgi:hypothetical protein